MTAQSRHRWNGPAMNVLFLTFAFPVLTAWAGDIPEKELSRQELLAIGKLTGACGVFRQMATFQGQTQLEGGDQFAARFLRAEAARLGKTPAQYVEACNKVIATYNELWNE